MSARSGVEHGTNTVSADSRRGPPTFKWHCKALWWRASTIWYVNVLRSFVSCHLPHLTARNPKGHREAWFMYFIPVGGISKWQHGFKWDGGGGMRVPIIHLYFHRFPFLEMHYNGMGISRGMLRNRFWKLSLSYLLAETGDRLAAAELREVSEDIFDVCYFSDAPDLYLKFNVICEILG